MGSHTRHLGPSQGWPCSTGGWWSRGSLGRKQGDGDRLLSTRRALHTRKDARVHMNTPVCVCTGWWLEAVYQRGQMGTVVGQSRTPGA